MSGTAASAAEAEVQAKTLFLAGAEAAVKQANDSAIPAVLVTQDGRTLLTGGIE
jgi:thiamine biosynthesis lipoprotein ApbE